MTTTAPENDDLGIDPTGGADDATDDAADTVEEYTAPTAEEWKRTQEALAKANGEARKYRLQARSGAPADDEDEPDGKPDLAKARAEEKRLQKLAATEAESTWKPRLVKAHALAALAAAGAKAPDRLARLVDQSQITFDDDGEVEGLDDQVDALKGEYPELFGVAQKRQPRQVDGAPKRDAGGKKLSATEQQLQQAGLLG